MRAYRDTKPSMVMISSVGDRRHEVKPEISVIIVCENPADTDLLFDFLTANTNIADRRTKGHSTIDDVEQRPKAFSIEEMETELLNRWDKRINELEAVIETNNTTIDELKESKGRVGSWFCDAEDKLEKIKRVTIEQKRDRVNMYTALDEINNILEEDTDEDAAPTEERFRGRINKQYTMLAEYEKTVCRLVDNNADDRRHIEEQKATIEGLKACIVVHIHSKNNCTRRIESMESTRKDLLRACDKRQGLLMAIQKDMAAGVEYTKIERELNTAMEEL